MTVKELKAALEKMDENLDCVVSSGGRHLYPASSPQLIKAYYNLYGELCHDAAMMPSHDVVLLGDY